MYVIYNIRGMKDHFDFGHTIKQEEDDMQELFMIGGKNITIADKQPAIDIDEDSPNSGDSEATVKAKNIHKHTPHHKPNKKKAKKDKVHSTANKKRHRKNSSSSNSREEEGIINEDRIEVYKSAVRQKCENKLAKYQEQDKIYSLPSVAFPSKQVFSHSLKKK